MSNFYLYTLLKLMKDLYDSWRSPKLNSSEGSVDLRPAPLRPGANKQQPASVKEEPTSPNSTYRSSAPLSDMGKLLNLWADLTNQEEIHAVYNNEYSKLQLGFEFVVPTWSYFNPAHPNERTYLADYKNLLSNIYEPKIAALYQYLLLCIQNRGLAISTQVSPSGSTSVLVVDNSTSAPSHASHKEIEGSLLYKTLYSYLNVLSSSKPSTEPLGVLELTH
jgi:hypothetical protein